MLRGSWCSKSSLAKAAGAEVAVPSRQMKNGTPLWREAHFQVKMYKTPHGRSNFWSSDVQKWHAAVARSTFASQNAHKKPQGRTDFATSDVQKSQAAVARSSFVSQNAQKTSGRGRFCYFRCQEMARPCGAKLICKPKCTKHVRFAAFWEVSNWLAN